jgi:hypothetical protein
MPQAARIRPVAAAGQGPQDDAHRLLATTFRTLIRSRDA